MDSPRVYIGWDPREELACHVAHRSLTEQSPQAEILPLELAPLRLRGLYYRPTSQTATGALWDAISGAPMSTEHAISRFLVPQLCRYAGWALFVDGDVLFRRPIEDLWALRQDRYALMCVPHPPFTDEHATKKDGQPNPTYRRKNWSSVMLFNCSHPANRLLTTGIVNEVPGRHLHAFGWLMDADIGALPSEWNYLVGVNPSMADPAIVHYTLGTPAMPTYAQSPFADEWYACARRAGHGQGHER